MSYFSNHRFNFLLMYKYLKSEKAYLYYLIAPDQLYLFYLGDFPLRYCLKFKLKGPISLPVLTNRVSEAFLKRLEYHFFRPRVLPYKFKNKHTFKRFLDEEYRKHFSRDVIDHTAFEKLHEDLNKHRKEILDYIYEGW